MISVHVEVLPHLHRTIAYIKSRGAKAGAVLNPSTPVSMLEDIAGDLDFVLVMSVNPGLRRPGVHPAQPRQGAARARPPRRAPAPRAAIEIDGGIDGANAADVVAAGATILVAGSAIFGSPRPGSGHARAARRQPASAAGSRADRRFDATRVRVRYAETDRMGVVYYANYLVWFEVGRTDWLRETGWTYREMEQDGVSLPVIEAHCEYRQPARYDDELEIRDQRRRCDAGPDPVRLRAQPRRRRHGDCRAGTRSMRRWTRTAAPAGCPDACGRCSVTGCAQQYWTRPGSTC